MILFRNNNYTLNRATKTALTTRYTQLRLSLLITQSTRTTATVLSIRTKIQPFYGKIVDDCDTKAYLSCTSATCSLWCKTIRIRLTAVSVRPTRHIIGYFGDESFQAIDCTGTDNQKQGHKTLHTSGTPKTKRKNCPSWQNKLSPVFSMPFMTFGKEMDWALFLQPCSLHRAGISGSDVTLYRAVVV